MSFLRLRWPFVLIGLAVVAFLIYQIPWVRDRIDWRLQLAEANVRESLNPVGELPPPQVLTTASVAVTQVVATAAPTAVPEFTPTPLPPAVQLAAPAHESQSPNNCGPATLAMYLRYYGWEGDQHDISDEIKPVSADRNVNVDELDYYVRTQAGWLTSLFRVGGDIELMKTLLAAGIPVMIEEGEIILNQGPEDDNWAAHYILLTGYDDDAQTFTYQDSFRGANHTAPYEQVDQFWQQFNRVYLLLYRPDQEETVKAILGADWDEGVNRQNALATAQAETTADPENAYAWFNLGMNQVYFEDYGAAAASFDQARTIGLPKRMLRYQFGPFWAYYHANRADELQVILDFALAVTPNSEDVLLWQGWALYRSGDTGGALAQFRLAQAANPKSIYVEQALISVGANP